MVNHISQSVVKPLYHMASSVSRQDESNLVPERARWYYLARAFIYQVCSVKMTGYWSHSFFREFMDLNSISVHKHAKKELGQYPASLTSRLVNNPYILCRCSALSANKVDVEVNSNHNIYQRRYLERRVICPPPLCMASTHFQLCSSILVPETELSIRSHCGQKTKMHRVESYVIYLQGKNFDYCQPNTPWRHNTLLIYLKTRWWVQDFYLNNRVLLLRNYWLIVAPWKFDVLKINICPRSKASR